MRILVIGGYGLIGAYVVARLQRDGHAIIGFGREVGAARRRSPKVAWVQGDLAAMTLDAWRAVLAGVDAVVNCAGALQDSPRDPLRAVHVDGVMRLAEACARADVRRFIQISAVGVDRAATEFGRTKREAEDAIRASDLDWLILRPGLVLAPTAYGGSALLRGIAAFPGATPILHPAARVQIISIEDLAEVVARALAPNAPTRVALDLVAPSQTTMEQIVLAMRAWLGLKPVPVLRVPAAIGSLAAGIADGLALLGWRSPMRSAALAQLEAGVVGQAGEAARLFAVAPRDIDDVLAAWPSGVQERWFARLYFVKPLALITLAAFWLVSGWIGFAARDAATAILTKAGLDARLASFFVVAGALVDVALGALIAVRLAAPFALRMTVLVSAGYLAGATLWRPDLWADPLGPLVKVIPAAVLALAALALMDER
jgi:uncharacterized protein YbjT (DUF2867 family)